MKSANEMYDHYFSQCCSLSRAKNEIEKKLENTNKELIECKEGNYYIQQYNNQLVKARDEVDAENEKLKQSIENLNAEINKLRSQNKTVISNNLKTLENIKSEKDSLISEKEK